MRAELERRPLFVAALGLILGLTAVLHPFHLLFILPAPFILQTLRARAVLVLGLVLGVLLGPGQDPPLIPDQYVTGDWTVETMPTIITHGQLAVISQSQARLFMFYDGPIPLCPGSVVRIEGIAKPPKEAVEAYYRLRSVSGAVEVKSGQLEVVREGPWIDRAASSWRQRFLDFTSRNVPPDVAALEDSMCFRVDSQLAVNSATEVADTGTLHLFLASGLQTILIGYSLLWLLMWLPIPRWSQLALVAAVLTLYAIATGLSPTIVRVAIMTMISQSAYLFRREPDWPSALAASSTAYLLWNPSGIYEMGFQFSSIAVLFIAMFAGHQKWKPGFEAWLFRTMRRSIRTAVVGYAVTTPLLAFYFGAFSLVTVPVCLILVIAVVPIVLVSMAALPLSMVVPSAGSMLIKTTIPLGDFVYKAIDTYGGPAVVARVPPFSPYWLVPFYGLLLLLWRPFVRRP